MIKRGLKSDSEVFYVQDGNDVVVPAGTMPFLIKFGAVLNIINEHSTEEIKEHIASLKLPFKLYDYQEKCVIESLQNKVQLNLAATGSGKSLIIFCIVTFLDKKGLKGLVLVPSISLTTQLFNDFKDYGASDEFLKKIKLIGGENNIKDFYSRITIGTWQSVMRITKDFDTLGYVIIDEAHGLKLDNCSTDIVYKAINAKYRLGLTGTLPEDPIAKLSIMCCVGAPVRYIKTQGLIERGLATPVHINVLHLKYSNEDKSLFKYVGNYAKRLIYIKEHYNRNRLIAGLSRKVMVNGNTIVLCSHIQHMKDIFTELITQIDPSIELENKHFSGKSAVQFQEKMGVYYISGATKVKDREKIFSILKEHSNAVVISNYSIMSTGLNIKSLKNIVFASPLKSYTTITQSIGRAIRVHVSKNTAEIYDFVDDFSARGNSGPFWKQYENRLHKSYMPEGFPMTEKIIHI